MYCSNTNLRKDHLPTCTDPSARLISVKKKRVTIQSQGYS
jgi:hypothetical protein